MRAPKTKPLTVYRAPDAVVAKPSTQRAVHDSNRTDFTIMMPPNDNFRCAVLQHPSPNQTTGRINQKTAPSRRSSNSCDTQPGNQAEPSRRTAFAAQQSRNGDEQTAQSAVNPASVSIFVASSSPLAILHPAAASAASLASAPSRAEPISAPAWPICFCSGAWRPTTMATIGLPKPRAASAKAYSLSPPISPQ